MKHLKLPIWLGIGIFLILFSCTEHSPAPVEDQKEEIVNEKEEETKEEETPEFTVNDSAFYTPPSTFGLIKNLVADYAVNNSDNQDDSEKLQAAIDELTAQTNGGKLIIPAGKYYLHSIQLKSNVHIEIDEGATLYPTFIADNRNHRIFDAGYDHQGKAENFSVIGTGKGYTVELRETTDKKLTIFRLGSIANFKLSNFIIQDNETIFASILLNPALNDGVYSWATNGIIEKGSNYNANIGYGLVQTYAADKILFRDVYSEGGVTLRFETDNLVMKESGKGGIRHIYAEDVRGEDGLTPVMFSPHFMQNGSVRIDKVHAKNCAFAVRVEEGFVEIFDEPGETREDLIARVEALIGTNSIAVTYRRGAGTRWAARLKNEFSEIAYKKTGLKPGVFELSTVTNVTAEYGNTAQLKQKFLNYLSCSNREKVCLPQGSTGTIYIGPSVAPVYDNTLKTGFGGYQVDILDLQMIGFPSGNLETIAVDTPSSGCAGISWPRCN